MSWQDTNDEYLRRRMNWLRGLLQAEHMDGVDAQQAFTANCCEDLRQDVTSELPTFEVLKATMGLSEYECDLLFLCAAMEFDTRVPELCAVAQDDLNRPYPTLALAMTLFKDPAWDAMSPERPLRRLRLIEVHQPPGTPLISASLRADERIVSYIKGLNYLDDRLTPLILPPRREFVEGLLTPSQLNLASDISRNVLQLVKQGEQAPLVQLLGSDQASKQQVAEAVAHEFGLTVYRLAAELIPSDIAEQETLLRLWQREALLLPIALYVDSNEFVEAADNLTSPLIRFLSRAGGFMFLDTPQVRHNVNRATELVDVDKPTGPEQRELWSALLGKPDSARRLASQFSLDCRSVHEIAARATSRISAVDDPDAASEKTQVVWDLCRKHTRPRLDSLAERIDCKATWDELVLPDEPLALLREIAGQIKHRDLVYEDWGFARQHNRGLGTSVLFAGESGTGKTMAAEVVAGFLNLDLYRIDLSQVVNKYIGETEKNLRRLFDAADNGGVVLFFDEADALFGKRTEVKDAHDRFANIETNYLLQRMETYRGLAILATNLKSSLDKAFLRRLRYVINFPVPDTKLREAIWRRAFPSETPTGYLDFDRLSRFNLTGGNIHTIALNSAFASANLDEPVGMSQILGSAQQEYRKLQKPVSSTDFRCSEANSSHSTPIRT